MSATEDLKAAGFSDDEIKAFVADKAKTLTDAGFSTKEVTDYLGVAPAIQPQARVAKGMAEAWTAGYQRSIPGLVDRSALPDVTLDPHQNTWYERLVGNVATVVNEGPESVAGAVIGVKGGALAGSPFGPVGATAGAVIGGGAGSMYVPEVIRTAYAKAIREGQITSKTDWLGRVKFALKNMATEEAQVAGAKGAAVGAAMGGVGRVVAPALTRATAGAVATGAMTQRTAAAITASGTLGAEYATVVAAPAALEGRLPEPHEFIDAATILAGAKGATIAATRMVNVYQKTGRTPAQQLADAADTPSIREDFVRGTEAEQRLREEVQRQGIEVQEIDPTAVDLALFDLPGEAPARQPGRMPTDVAWGAKDVDRNVSPSSTDLAALKADIEKNGVQKPITVTVSTADGMAYVTDGNNRLAAARELGITEVPYKVELTDVPFTAEQKAKAKPTQELGLTDAELAPKAKSAEALAAEAELKKLLGEDYVDADIPRAYQKQAAEMAAQEALPDPKAKAAQVLDSPMTALPQTKLPHQLNLRYVEAPADVQALLTRMAEVYKPEIEAQRNGTQTWEQTAATARTQIQDMLGPDAQRILQGRQGGDAVNTVELKIRSDMLMQATLDLSGKLEVVRKAGDQATPAQRAEALEAVHKLSMIQSELTGAAAEAGRALNQLKAIKVLRDQGGDIAKMVEMYGRDPDTMLQMLADMQTPEQLSRLVAEASKPGGWQKFIEFYRAGLMSGFLTVGYNVAGNATFLAQRNFLIEPAAALVGLITRSPDRVTMTEAGARLYGSLYMAPMSMVRSMANAYRHDGVKGAALQAWEAGQGVAPAPVVNTGVVGKFTKAVYGTNAMLDAAFRELTTQGDLYAMATKEAINKGHEPGTLDFFREVKAMVENPTEAMVKSAETAATRSVFATPVGKLGQAFNAFADRVPAARFFVPFVQTPTNILKETFRNSPFAPLVDSWRADMAKGGATRDKAVAEMAVGSALFTAAYLLALDGRITGSLDPDPKKKAVQMAAGMQPYSYKTSDGEYVPLVRIAPTVGTMVGMAADIAQLQDYMEPEEQHKVGKMAMMTFKNAVTNQTMLAGLTNVLKAMDDENSFSRYVNSTAGSLVPASGMLGQIASVKDPYAREIYGVLDSVKYKIPGVRETLEPKIDAFGVPVPEAERPLFIAPIKITKESEDKVRTEAARLGVSSSKPPKNVDVGINMGRIGMVELTPEQRTAYATAAGELAYRIVEPVVNSPLWDRTPDLIQRQIMQDALEAGRSYATATVFTPQQLQQEIRTRAEELRKRLQPK